jgi:hypothetical protein
VSPIHKARPEPQLRGGDGGDRDLFGGAELGFQARGDFGHRVIGRKSADRALEFDEDGGV